MIVNYGLQGELEMTSTSNHGIPLMSRGTSGKSWQLRTENNIEIVEKFGVCNCDYHKACGNNGFVWDEVKREFDWHNTGRVNIAHEAIDRHAVSWRKNKVALYWEGPNKEQIGR